MANNSHLSLSLVTHTAPYYIDRRTERFVQHLRCRDPYTSKETQITTNESLESMNKADDVTHPHTHNGVYKPQPIMSAAGATLNPVE